MKPRERQPMRQGPQKRWSGGRGERRSPSSQSTGRGRKDTKRWVLPRGEGRVLIQQLEKQKANSFSFFFFFKSLFIYFEIGRERERERAQEEQRAAERIPSRLPTKCRV